MQHFQNTKARGGVGQTSFNILIPSWLLYTGTMAVVQLKSN